MSDFIVKPAKKLRGNIKVPGDKSISHRAVMLGSLASGITKITGFLEGEDALATLKAFEDMGVKIQRRRDNVTIYGVGLNGLKKPSNPLDMGNSGTAMRLMLGLMVAQKFDTQLVGDNSLSKRPMNRVIKPLIEMGAIISSNNGKPPLKITGGQKLKAIKYNMPVASAQVKSCLLLAGLYADGKTCITEPATTRDHSERMLKGFGYEVDNICLTGGSELKGANVQVPSDISSAAFFMVAASIALDADITLTGVSINPTRTGIIDILKLMGGNISLTNKRKIGGELLADIRVKSAKLKAIDIPQRLVPLAIDEFPVIFIAASCAKGQTVLTRAKELRVKESDRIAVMADGLSILGIKNKVLDDGIKITGGIFKKPVKAIKSSHDHRISMAFAVASVVCDFAIEITGVDNVKTSFPNFVHLANKLGMSIVEK